MAGERIMIVEDSPAVAELIREKLLKEGYEVYAVKNGFEALRDLDEIRPSLIITDINMPKLDGLKLAHGIKNRPETSDIPFIFLSSQLDEDTLKKGRDLGACYFIAKPFEMDKILDCIRQVLG